MTEQAAESTESKVKAIIVKQLGVAEEAVVLNKSFVDDLGADSLDVVELVMAMEEEFGFEIPDTEAENIRTVGDAVKYVTSCQGWYTHAGNDQIDCVEQGLPAHSYVKRDIQIGFVAAGVKFLISNSRHLENVPFDRHVEFGQIDAERDYVGTFDLAHMPKVNLKKRKGIVLIASEIDFTAL